jgi:type I restriction enzyme, S subunit
VSSGETTASTASDLTLLGEILTIRHGFAFKGEYFVDSPEPHQLTTPGNFAIGGGFQLGKPKYYGGPIPSDYVLSPGDLIVTMTDLSKAGDTLGYSAIVPKTPGTTWLHNQRIGLVRPTGDRPVDLRYMSYVLRSQDYRNHVLGGATGSTVRHTSPNRILSFAIRLPDIDQQRAVADLLETLDDRIEMLRETNATLEGIAQALFKSWFVDFDPVRAKSEGRAPEGMDAATAALFPDTFQDSPLGPIPTGWSVAAIGDCVDLAGGSTPDTKESAFWTPEEFAWATPKDLSGATSVSLQTTQRRVSHAGLARISSGLLPVGTLLMSSRAPIGYIAITAIPVAINQGFIAMRPGGVLPPIFLLHWCRQNMDLILGSANGSTFAEISKRSFRPLRVVRPRPAIVERFSSVVEGLYQSISEAEAQAGALASLRNELLPRLISGRLRLTEPNSGAGGLNDR